MTRRQLYFLKQKLIGVVILGIGILTAVLALKFDPDFLIAAIIFFILGIHFIVTEEMVWVDDYWYEVDGHKKEVKKNLEEKEIRSSYRRKTKSCFKDYD